MDDIIDHTVPRFLREARRIVFADTWCRQTHSTLLHSSLDKAPGNSYL